MIAAPGPTGTPVHLAVPASSSAWSSGGVTLAFGADQDYSGSFWSSIDSYDRIAFHDGSTLLWSGRGDSVTTPANGCQACQDMNRYVNFDFGAQGFDRIVLTGLGRASETDNHAYGQGPAPGALALLGIGLAALALSRRR